VQLGITGDFPLRNLFKNLALFLPPVKKVHTDLENRRRRVAELEGHLRVMKKQMAKVLKQSNFATLNESQSSSDISHVKGQLDKLTNQHVTLKKKYDALYRDYCILSMSNEALTETNASMLSGNFFDKSQRSNSSVARNQAATNRKGTTHKASTSRNKSTSARKTKTSAKAKQK